MRETLVWVLASERSGLGRLNELFNGKFIVRECSGLSRVWTDLLRGQPGVLIADLSGRDHVSATERAKLGALATFTPVVLLIDDPWLAYLAHSDFAMCSALFQPFDDPDRLVQTTLELSQLPSRVGFHSIGAF